MPVRVEGAPPYLAQMGAVSACVRISLGNSRDGSDQLSPVENPSRALKSCYIRSRPRQIPKIPYDLRTRCGHGALQSGM